MPPGPMGKRLRPLVAAYETHPEMRPYLYGEIAKALARVLWAGMLLAIPLLIVLAAPEEGLNGSWATIAPRVIAATGTVASVAVIVWVMRTVPDRLLRSMLRRYRIVSARLVFVIVAVFLGVTVTIFGKTPVTLSLALPLLIIGLFVLRWMGPFRISDRIVRHD